MISPCLLLLRQQGQGPAQRNESAYLVTSTDSRPDLMLVRTLLHFSPHSNNQETQRIKDGTQVPSQVFPPYLSASGQGRLDLRAGTQGELPTGKPPCQAWPHQGAL